METEIAAGHKLVEFKQTADSFFKALEYGEYDHIWNDLISSDAAKFLCAVLWPIYADKQGKTDDLFKSMNNPDFQLSIKEAMAVAFQMNLEGIRTGFFQSIATGMKEFGWFDYSRETSLGFTDQSAGILVADTPGISLLLPFILDEGKYKVDFEALVVFSNYVTAATLYRIGTRASEMGKRESALVYFELAASLAPIYRRVQTLMWEHPIVMNAIKADRRKEFEQDIIFVTSARDQVLLHLSQEQSLAVPFDTDRFLLETFMGYGDISNTLVTESDIELLHDFDDKRLREAIATILMGVNPVVAERQAKKPHTPAEIADMEIPVEVNGSRYFLCMPFKSGREIRGKAVPVDIAYQIIRPFMYFPNCIVIFVTAKPCSQHLHSYINVAKATQGWAIEVIEHEELAKLLRFNELL